MNDRHPAAREPVIVVGAGPAGCAVSLLLADVGIPVPLLERQTLTRCPAPCT
jgi:2-polyprenyl-6-methoxyphenol hydroxylase-like FAD-dependent oxidoreductase